MRINPIFSSTHLDIPHYFFSYKRPKMKIPVDMGRKKKYRGKVCLVFIHLRKESEVISLLKEVL